MKSHESHRFQELSRKPFTEKTATKFNGGKNTVVSYIVNISICAAHKLCIDILDFAVNPNVRNSLRPSDVYMRR